uniref:Uncharacterized protein n=1 Tax=Pyxicephalus adspersus TaxID=30357 RepID=A0AAV3B499_PYXAD|nr:TPA: hypothetical protein GDO54_000755 [Pyxicephalus adspersus]
MQSIWSHTPSMFLFTALRAIAAIYTHTSILFTLEQNTQVHVYISIFCSGSHLLTLAISWNMSLLFSKKSKCALDSDATLK